MRIEITALASGYQVEVRDTGGAGMDDLGAPEVHGCTEIEDVVTRVREALMSRAPVTPPAVADIIDRALDAVRPPNATECPFCASGDSAQVCGDRRNSLGHACTRESGHRGVHIACIADRHGHAVYHWSEMDDPPQPPA